MGVGLHFRQEVLRSCLVAVLAQGARNGRPLGDDGVCRRYVGQGRRRSPRGRRVLAQAGGRRWRGRVGAVTAGTAASHRAEPGPPHHRWPEPAARPGAPSGPRRWRPEASWPARRPLLPRREALPNRRRPGLSSRAGDGVPRFPGAPVVGSGGWPDSSGRRASVGLAGTRPRRAGRLAGPAVWRGWRYSRGRQ